MGEVHQMLLGIEQFATQLAQQNKLLKAKNDELVDQMAKLEKQLRSKEDDLVMLKNELNNKAMAQGLTAGGADSKKVKAKINSLVREIDRCIDLLNE